jgi:hypothetical protein
METLLFEEYAIIDGFWMSGGTLETVYIVVCSDYGCIAVSRFTLQYFEV